ncbi:MAG: universal stress protein [Pseudomonadota bacterium]
MAYQTMLVHVDNDPGNAIRVSLAATLAANARAHLVGAAFTGVSRHLYHSMPPEQDDPTLALHLAMLREQAQSALADFAGQCASAGLNAYAAKLIDDEAGDGLSLHARAADLVLLSQADPDARATAAGLPVHVVTHSGRPVLLLPFGFSGRACGQHVLVSWNASREAARALQLSLPMLQAAQRVEIAVFDTGASEQALADAFAADPRPWLARHGVNASLAVHTVEKRRVPHRRHEVGEALLAHAGASGADLLVMGAYGHSRFRESILGGVTRTVLDAMALPVLMAH